MNNIEKGFERIRARWPKSKVLKLLRDNWGTYGLNVLIDGQIGVFSVKVSKKQPLEAAKRGVFLSCHARLCDHNVPVFILHNDQLWQIKPQAITSAFAFRNFLHGACMLNFYTTDVQAKLIASFDSNVERCIDCGGPVDGGALRCPHCMEGFFDGQ